MKKLSLLSFLTLLTLSVFLVGCGKDEVETESPGNQTQEQTQITDNEEIDTSDWQTYRNEELGYEVKYPKDWEVNLLDGASFSRHNCLKNEYNQCSRLVNISGYKDISNYKNDINDWKPYCEKADSGKFSNLESDVVFCEIVKINKIDKADIYYFINNRGDGFEVTVRHSVAQNNKELEEEIISTLKFTNP